MATVLGEQTIRSLEIVKEEDIAASIADVFETVLEQLGPGNESPGTGAMPMTLEAWPGGRWFRDLGKGAGHFWGHVQAIKPPFLLELCGPLFMSHPGMSNVQFRLTRWTELPVCASLTGPWRSAIATQHCQKIGRVLKAAGTT